MSTIVLAAAFLVGGASVVASAPSIDANSLVRAPAGGGQAGGAPRAPVIVGYERLRESTAVDDRARGEVLLGELNCLSCHAVSEPSLNGIARRITTKPAPDLAGIGERVTPAWLAGYLRDVRGDKPGSTMPDLLHGFAPAERDRMVDRLTHFLIGQSGTLPLAEHRPFRFRATVERGRDTYHRVGCVACHEPDPGGEATTTPTSVPLPDLSAKTSVGPLARFLLAPNDVRHGGRMPSLHLSEKEASDIAVYLLRAQEPDFVDRVAGLEFEYFEIPPPATATTSRPPAIEELTPDGFGHVDALSLELPIPTRGGNRMLRFTGVISIDQAGRYTFLLRSDRRSFSELRIDGRAVATKPAETGREIAAELELAAGDHGVEISYYILGSTPDPFVDVTVAGATIADPVSIDAMVAYEDVALAPPASAPLVVDADLAAEGSVLFAEIGCSNCHALESAAAGVAPRYPATPIDRLRVDPLQGGSPVHRGAGTPRYHLAGHQRAAIAAALTDVHQLAVARGPERQVLHTLATHNCYACHDRSDAFGELGGLDAARREHFRVVDNMDLGDEGRIPPTLTGIGGKLRPEALAAVLRDETMQVRRNFMEARMPRFSGALLDALPAALDRTDAVDGDLLEPVFSRRAVEDGLRLVGSTGFRCITCHDVGVNTAAGISTINLATAYDRLRPGWVRRLLRDPHAINEDTRMPAFWTGGSIIFPDVAFGTVDGQIDAILSYLSLGASMPIPTGMNLGESLVLRPTDEPILFRTFMTDASPRAIVVGYPESVHVAFDANVIRTAKLWRGGFFDAQGTWIGRAGQFFDPYGADVVSLPPGPALAFLEHADAPWPDATMNDRNVGGEFLGYRLDDQRRPIFTYRLGGVDVEEDFTPVVRPGGTDLVRRFTIEAGNVSADLYLLAGEGDEIVHNADGSWSIDGTITVTVRASTEAAAIVRSSQGVQQLLVPVGITLNETVSIEVEMSW